MRVHAHYIFVFFSFGKTALISYAARSPDNRAETVLSFPSPAPKSFYNVPFGVRGTTVNF